MAKFRTEFLAGLTTFLTMSYIIFVNPAILSSPGTGMSFSGVMTATVLLCFVCTLLMGLYARLPFAVAPGMGINAFFTFTLVLGEKIPWPTALGMVFWSGVMCVIVSITPLREKIVQALPNNIKVGCAVGIGVFLSFIGLKNAGLVIDDPETFVRMGKLEGPALLAFLGLFVMLPLMKMKNPLAFLTGIAVVTLASLLLGYTTAPQTLIAPPDFESVFFKLDIWGGFKVGICACDSFAHVYGYV